MCHDNRSKIYISQLEHILMNKRIEPFRHKVISDPDLYARKCKEVTDAIHKFFVGDYHMAYEALYRSPPQPKKPLQQPCFISGFSGQLLIVFFFLK